MYNKRLCGARKHIIIRKATTIKKKNEKSRKVVVYHRGDVNEGNFASRIRDEEFQRARRRGEGQRDKWIIAVLNNNFTTRDSHTVWYM